MRQFIETRLQHYSALLDCWRATGANVCFKLALAALGEAYAATTSLPVGAERDELAARIKHEAAAMNALLPHATRDIGREIARA